VSVAGTTNDGDFSLANGPFVFGAFRYEDVIRDGKNWLLKSGGYSVVASAYENLPQTMLTLNQLPTFHQRLGVQRNGGEAQAASFLSQGNTRVDPQLMEALTQQPLNITPLSLNAASIRPAEQEELRKAKPVWMHVTGGDTHVDGSLNTSGGDYDTEFWKVQSGVTIESYKGENGQLLTGLNASFSKAKSDIDTPVGNSAVDTDGYSVGLTTTWYADGGLYVDAQAQYSRYDSDLSSSDSVADVNDVDGEGRAFSVELGKRFAVNGYKSLLVTPQAQLIYSDVTFDDFIGTSGETVAIEDGSSMKARVGMSLDRFFVTKEANSHLYAIANVIHEFRDEAEVVVSGAKLEAGTAEWTGELGIGGSYQPAKEQHAFYGELVGDSSFEGDSYSIRATVGFSLRF